MRAAKFVLAAGAAALLAGCTETYPPLYSRLEPRQGETTLDQILRSADATRETYSRNYQATAKNDDLFNVALVGAAAVAAGLVFGEVKDLAKWLGYGALGVGAVTAARGVASPSGMTALYIGGHQALGCVIAEGPLFTGSPEAKDRRARLAATTGTTAALAAEARDLYANSSIDSTDAQTRADYQKASSDLNDAVLATDVALLAARREAAAYDTAETVFEGTVDAIQTKVATKGREGRAVDYAKLATDLAASAAGAGASLTGGDTASGAATTANGVLKANTKAMIDQALLNALREVRIGDADAATIAKLRSMAALLKDRTAALAADTPAYGRALERVAGCPAKVAA